MLKALTCNGHLSFSRMLKFDLFKKYIYITSVDLMRKDVPWSVTRQAGFPLSQHALVPEAQDLVTFSL